MITRERKPPVIHLTPTSSPRALVIGTMATELYLVIVTHYTGTP